MLRQLGGVKLLWPRVPPPPQEVRVNRRWLSGRLHSKGRDASAISHHYDVSNTFYEWVLGPSMAYTCACYPSEDATLEEAQANKFDLVARKLGLRPGCGCSMWAAAGAAWSCTPPVSTACARSG